jgi:hypothetical protein
MTDLIFRPEGGTHTGQFTPVYSQMQQCLRMQSEAEPRGRVARAIGRSPLHPGAKAAFAGALGEREVAHILSELGSNWIILRDATAQTASASYLVIGPPGIFSLSERFVDGARVKVGELSLEINGVESSDIRTSLGDATRTERQLSETSKTRVGVSPILVISGSGSLRFGKQPPEVDVLRAADLRSWFLGRVRTISDDTVSFFAHVALRSGNWNRHTSLSGDLVRHVQRFERLQQEIASAQRHRRRLIVGAGVLLVAIVSLVLALVL